MGYTINDIEKIMGFKSWSVREKTSELLRIDSNQYCNQGIDSTVKEKEITRVNSRKIYLLIKKINPEMGNLFLLSMDRKE